MFYCSYLYGTITLCGISFQIFLIRLANNGLVLQPQLCRNIAGLGCSAFARHYLRNHFCFLLLRLLRCFSSAGLLTLRCTMSSTQWVAPFGYLRIISCVPIPAAFRSLSRPSSPLRATGIPHTPLFCLLYFCAVLYTAPLCFLFFSTLFLIAICQ